MRKGLVLMAPTIRDQLEAARRAEARGFNSVWTTEFHNHNGLVRLTAVAMATQEITVGTAIAYAFMRSPVLTASAAMDVDELSGGRVILGLGSGTRTMNERWYSVPFDRPPAPRMREAVTLIREVFRAQKAGRLSFSGSHYRVSIPGFARPGAARPEIPIYVAAVNRGMIRAAASVADGLIGHPVYTRRYMREVVLPELEGSRCVLAPYVICSISDDVDRARREARAQIAFYYTTRLYHSILDVHGWRPIGEQIAQAFRAGDLEGMQQAVPDELVDAIALTGRPAEVRDRLRSWEGLTEHVLLYPATSRADPGRLRENVDAIIDCFGPAAR
ncbi:MAG: LLM class flavin-dependent oxidoreductase [Myxococcota bacterium]